MDASVNTPSASVREVLALRTADYLRRHPPIADYLRRIENQFGVPVEVKNFRKFVVQERTENGYPVYHGTIKINVDGKIEVTDPKYEPTPTERGAIEELAARADWPKHVLARDLSALPRNPTSVYYEFWDRKEDAIRMVEERQEPKAFYTWTLWSDGEWRVMEPSDGLSFWKPREKRALRIMVHEGAKAAAFIEDVVRHKKPHPWLDDLSDYEHWGIIGGAKAVRRSRFDELTQEEPTDLKYVTDHDRAGEEAAVQFSRLLKRRLSIVKFTKPFPIAFDLAEPFPRTEEFFDRDNYIGPPLRDFLRSGTWMTEALPLEGKARKPTFVLRDEVADEWLHTNDPVYFVHRDWPNRPLTGNALNAVCAPFTDFPNVASLLVKKFHGSATKLAYEPGQDKGLITLPDDGTVINTFVDSSIKPLDGDATPWLDFMEHLIPDETERDQTLAWLAMVMARPSIKMMYALLLVSDSKE